MGFYKPQFRLVPYLRKWDYDKKVQFPCKFTLPHTGYKWLQWASGQNAFHPGIDLNFGVGDQDLGNSVYTPFFSRIEYISPVATKANGYNGGYGNFVVLYHPSFDLWTKYAHLQSIVDIPIGTELYAGIHFANVGKSGTQSAHCHWEMFIRAMYEIQKNYRKNGTTMPFRFYPSGKSKSYVQQYYINPMQFMEEHLPSDFSKDDWEWALKNGIVNEKSLPREPMTTERYVVLQKNYHDKFHENS